MINKKQFDSGITLLVIATALCRLIPHWPNFTPVIGMALVGGAVFAKGVRAYVIPLLAMLISDLALGVLFGWTYAFHDAQVAVYLTIAAITLLGTKFSNSSALKTVLLGGTVSGIMFFLTTNFSVWLTGSMYPKTLTGLADCYGAGLAFYRDSGNFLINGIVSTWLTSAAMFGLIRIAQRRFGYLPATRSLR